MGHLNFTADFQAALAAAGIPEGTALGACEHALAAQGLLEPGCLTQEVARCFHTDPQSVADAPVTFQGGATWLGLQRSRSWIHDHWTADAFCLDVQDPDGVWRPWLISEAALSGPPDELLALRWIFSADADPTDGIYFPTAPTSHD